MTDPVEKHVAKTLTDAGIEFSRPEKDPREPRTLDFWLPDFGLYVECCRWVTERKIRQCDGLGNVLIVVGLDGAAAFRKLVGYTEGHPRCLTLNERRR